MLKFFFIILLNACFYKQAKSISLPLPLNEYAYVLARNNLESFDNNFYNLSHLTYEKEHHVNIYFEYLKVNEFKRTGLNNFYPLRPIETELENIINTELYAKLKLLPKGGNLHIHEFQMLNRRKLLEIIQNSDEYDLLYICDRTKSYCQMNKCSCLNYVLKYFKNLTETLTDGWIQVKDSSWTIDKILNFTILTNLVKNVEPKILPTDTSARWKLANERGVFSFYDDLTRYNKTRFDYLKACLDTSLDENVQLIEFRRSNFRGLYDFDQNGNRIQLSATDEIEALIRFKNDYLKSNPIFIDYNFLIYGSRGRSKLDIKTDLDAVINIQKKYPELIRGYDLVGEEDQGHTLLFHSDSLIDGFNFSYYSSEKSFGYYFHTGETNWPNDMIPSQYGDDGPTSDNIYDAIVFKTHRIGHGLAYSKHPNLWPHLTERKIGIEICPASNQLLGYVPDLRNHPAITFYKSGLPIVIAGDDPGSFGYNDLTVDYYLIFMAWGLSLDDLREIANNSIKYSSIPESTKLIGYNKFSTQWNKFIEQTYNEMCKLENDVNSLNITKIYPSYGPDDVSIKITLYGYGFESTFCQEIKCFFNDIQTKGYLNKLNEIICDTPLGFKNNDLASIKIGYSNRKFDTGLNYKFISSRQINLIYDGTTTNSASFKQFSFCFYLLAILFYFYF